MNKTQLRRDWVLKDWKETVWYLGGYKDTHFTSLTKKHYCKRPNLWRKFQPSGNLRKISEKQSFAQQFPSRKLYSDSQFHYSVCMFISTCVWPRLLTVGMCSSHCALRIMGVSYFGQSILTVEFALQRKSREVKSTWNGGENSATFVR